MIKCVGKVKGRYKGSYTDKNGEIKTKIVYQIQDSEGTMHQVTDFECIEQPFAIDQEVDVPVLISCFQNGGNIKYSLIKKRSVSFSNMEAF